MRDIDELRPLTAGRLLELWRESREASEDGLERTVICNARVLAACCYFQGEPVATIEGQRKYTLELTRLYATDDAVSDGINFYDLRDFSLVICKPDRKIIYSGCEWSTIHEEGQLNAMVAEKITVVASKRIETTA